MVKHSQSLSLDSFDRVSLFKTLYQDTTLRLKHTFSCGQNYYNQIDPDGGISIKTVLQLWTVTPIVTMLLDFMEAVSLSIIYQSSVQYITAFSFLIVFIHMHMKIDI